MESRHKDIKVPPLWLAHCETGLQADAQAAATPDSPGGERSEGRGWRWRGSWHRVWRSLYVFILLLLPVPSVSLSHTHTFQVDVWHVFAALSRVNGRVAAIFVQRTRSLNLMLLFFASAHHLLLGNLLAYAHTYSCTHTKVSLLGNPLAICLFILLCRQQIRGGEKAKSNSKY